MQSKCVGDDEVEIYCAYKVSKTTYRTYQIFKCALFHLSSKTSGVWCVADPIHHPTITKLSSKNDRAVLNLFAVGY